MKSDVKSYLLESHKAVFTALSKNGCTSMKAHIVKLLRLPQTIIYPRDVHELRVYGCPVVEDTELVTKYQSYLRYCIVRNPWSRLVSCFKNKIKESEVNSQFYRNGAAIQFTKISEEFRGGMSFTEFVSLISEIPDSKADKHFRSQLFDIITPTGSLRTNYIAKLENLREHLEEISQLTGMKFADYPILNNTDIIQHYTDFYTPETVEKVRIRYEGDVDLFNYKFGQESQFELGTVDKNKAKKIIKSPYFSNAIDQKKEKNANENQQITANNSEKLFCIGLNKTGTGSLNRALNILKLRTVHYESPIGRLGEVFKFNLENDRNLLNGIGLFFAFSDWIDMEGTNNDLFKIMDQQYPGSKFIFSDRDLKSWLSSRIKYVKKIDKLEKYQKALPESGWYNMNTDAWTEEYHRHKRDVLNYFKDRPNDLLIFNVFEGDGWEELCSFLKLGIPERNFPAIGGSTYNKKAHLQRNSLEQNIWLRNQKAIFCYLPGRCNLQIKASLISYVGKREKFKFSNNVHLVDNFPFPTFKGPVTHPAFNNHFRFTIVRNPWDRLVDCYKNIISSNCFPERLFKLGEEDSFNEHGDYFRRFMPFDEFIESVCSISEPDAHRYYSSQTYQLTSSSGELLVNYIGYYEHLKHAALDIYEQAKISLHEIPLSDGKVCDTSYTELYTEKLRDKVQEKYYVDLNLFGYGFGVPLENRVVDFVSDQFLSHFKSVAL